MFWGSEKLSATTICGAKSSHFFLAEPTPTTKKFHQPPMVLSSKVLSYCAHSCVLSPWPTLHNHVCAEYEKRQLVLGKKNKVLLCKKE